MRFEHCQRCTRPSASPAGPDDTDRLSEQLLCAWSGCEVGIMVADQAIDVLARHLSETQD